MAHAYFISKTTIEPIVSMGALFLTVLCICTGIHTVFKITQCHISKTPYLHGSIILHACPLYQFLLEPTVVSGVIMLYSIHTVFKEHNIIILFQRGHYEAHYLHAYGSIVFMVSCICTDRYTHCNYKVLKHTHKFSFYIIVIVVVLTQLQLVAATAKKRFIRIR